MSTNATDRSTVDLPGNELLCDNQPLPSKRFKPAAWLWSPCALYAISAACILVGIAQLVVPMYENPLLAMQKFYSLVALSVYEIMLLAVALTIVLWGQVYDDAIALTVLIGVFLIASATALDTVSPDFSSSALWFGAASLIMAGAKIYALDRYLVGRMSTWLLAAITVLLLWNFIMPGLLGVAQAHGLIAPQLRQVWLSGWWCALGGGVICLTSVAVVTTGDMGASDVGQPFLRTAAMRWIVAGILLFGTAAHGYALSWAFGLNVKVGELLPIAGLAALAVMEVTRGYGYRFNVVDTAVALVPVIAAGVVMWTRTYTTTPGDVLGLVAYPPVFLAMYAAGLQTLAWRAAADGHKPALHAVSALALAGAVATIGVSPAEPLPAAPLIVRAHDFFSQRPGWLLVAISFLVLALGAAVSLSKGRAAPRRQGVLINEPTSA